MKKIFYFLLLALVMGACGGKEPTTEEIIEEGNLEAIRAKRTELAEMKEVINEDLQAIDMAIAKLDTIKKPSLITIVTAKEEVFTHFFEVQGNVTTKELLVLTPEFNGILTDVYVKEGQKVAKGQTLARIDDGGLGQQLAQLEVQAELAKTTFERQKRLWEQKIGSEIQYLQAKTSYEAQAKAVTQLQQQIAKTIVKAPFSGTIDEVISEKGSVVAAGQTPLIRIVNLNNMYIETDVPERFIKDVTPGKTVHAEFPVLGESVETTVRQAGEYINPANRTFKVEVGLPKNKLGIKPNLTARLRINDYTNPKAILVPQSVISENAEGDEYVYIMEDENSSKEGKAKRVFITTGKTQGDVIEVLSGIENGMHIIKEGARSVKDGQLVQVVDYQETTANN